MHRLYFRIYLAVLGSLALFAVLVGASGWVFRELREPVAARLPPFLPEAVQHILPADASPMQLGQELAFWHKRTGFDLALLSPQGTAIAQAGSLAPGTLARLAATSDPAGIHWHPHGVFTIHLGDGRLLAAAPPPTSRFLIPLRWLGLVFGIGLAVAITTYPVIRRLTRNLERLQKGVAAFGGGDLKARVAVCGRDEVGKLAWTFNASADRIEALVTAQKRLLANASHELRSPLARLRMALEAIPGAAKEREEIARNIAELDGLVDEILLASRLDADAGAAGELRRIDLIGLLAEECAAFDANLIVVPGQPVAVAGDPRLLHRLFRNLLENARRHGGEGPIDVSVERGVSDRPGDTGEIASPARSPWDSGRWHGSCGSRPLSHGERCPASRLPPPCATEDENVPGRCNSTVFWPHFQDRDRVMGDSFHVIRRLSRYLPRHGRRAGKPAEPRPGYTGPTARVTVCDRGPGIPEAGRARIFEPFYRLAGHAEHAGGMGLGLALVRQIAEKHGGWAACLPREGGGACFEVILPLDSSGAGGA